LKEETTMKILKILLREEAFYLFASIGNCTGISASSLKESKERLTEVDVKSGVSPLSWEF